MSGLGNSNSFGNWNSCGKLEETQWNNPKSTSWNDISQIPWDNSNSFRETQWSNPKHTSWNGISQTLWYNSNSNTWDSHKSSQHDWAYSIETPWSNFKSTSWSNPYDTKQSQSFNSYYDESSESDSYEDYFSEESSSVDSWDYDIDTFVDSEGVVRDKETNRKVTKIKRSDKSKTYCLYPHGDIPGETKRDNKTIKIWKDKK